MHSSEPLLASVVHVSLPIGLARSLPVGGRMPRRTLPEGQDTPNATPRARPSPATVLPVAPTPLRSPLGGSLVRASRLGTGSYHPIACQPLPVGSGCSASGPVPSAPLRRNASPSRPRVPERFRSYAIVVCSWLVSRSSTMPDSMSLGTRRQVQYSYRQTARKLEPERKERSQ